MKIGITCYPTYGGSGVVATELGKKLANLGNEVHFISYALPYRLNEFTTNIFFHEVEVLKYPLFEYPPYSLSLASKMAEIIAYQKLDLLHVHYAIPHATSAYLAKQLIQNDSFKIITTLHGTDITLLGNDPSFFKITKFSIEKSDGVTAVSEFLKSETHNVFNIKNPIQVIPNFIPLNLGEPEKLPDVRKRFADEDEYIISHISNFRPLKRVTDIIPIIKNVLKKEKVKVLMIGDGPERYKAEELSRQQNLSDKIYFLGKQENIHDLLCITDLFLLPSETESFGLAVLEAMAFGIPCITSNAGGLVELNLDSHTGFTLPVGDIEAFADSILKLLFDEKLYHTMGKNAKDFAVNNFACSKIVPEYINFYNSVLNEK
jgi:N-acetyl-alpha-D-glucosaminyl L-malate synthase BshA